MNLQDIKSRITKDSEGVSNYKNIYIDEMDWLVQQAEKTELLRKQLDAKIILINNGWEEERYVLQEENEQLRKRIDKVINNIGKNASPTWVVRTLKGEEGY